MWHFDVPTKEELVALAGVKDTHVVSIYLPTTPMSHEAHQDSIVLFNLAKQADEQVAARGATSEELEAIDDQLFDIVDDYEFWRHQGYGLGIIATPHHHWTFRLPTAPAESLKVSDRPAVFPLVAALSQSTDFHVLALSEGAVRLVDVESDLRPVLIDVPELPESASDHAGKASINDRSHSGRLTGSEGKNILIAAYARAVDKALRPILRGDERPLILMATQPINGIYRKLNSYPGLLDVGVEVSPDEMTPEEIANAIEPVREEYFTLVDQERAALIDQRRGQNRVREDLAGIAKAAVAGAVDTLYVDAAYNEIGTISDSGDIDLGAGDSPIIEDLIRIVAAADGRVVALDASRLPGERPHFALLRWVF